MSDDPRPAGSRIVHVPAPSAPAHRRPSLALHAVRDLPATSRRRRPAHVVDPCEDRFADRTTPPSWEDVAERYGDTVFTMAFRLTGNRDEARDLAQDVFVRVYRNLDRYRPGSFEGWLYRITENLFLDRMRRRARVRMEPLPDEEWRQPPEAGPGPAEAVEAGVLRGDLELALRDLAPLFRTAVVLCDVQGLSYEEIATATGWPIGTVRSRIHRGRRVLRGSLEHQAGR